MTRLTVTQIEKVFEAAMRQKAWDHFTKAQRKHIDVWFKQIKVCIPFLLLQIN